MQVLGSTVFVTDLKYVLEWDDGERPYRNPLLVAFESLGADVLLEGPGRAVSADLTCAGPEEAVALVGDDLADFALLREWFVARPQWHPAGLTPSQRLARHSFRLLQSAYLDGFQDLVDEDDEIRRHARELGRGSGQSPEASAPLMRRAVELLAQAQPELAKEDLDPAVVGWFVADEAELDALVEKAAKGVHPSERELEDRRLAEIDKDLRRGRRLGQLPYERAPDGKPVLAPADADHRLLFAEIGQSPGRLDVGLAEGPRIAVLFPALARYLHEGGCTQLAYALSRSTSTD